MKTLSQNPCQWRLSTLLSLQTSELHELACWATGTITSYRLVLGRCLLAMHESKGYESYGCSTAVHYGTAVLGLSTRVARESKRVAFRLQTLPRLTIASERGELAWTKLRELVRVASPATEAYWIELAGKYDCERLQKLVSMTPEGQIPGEIEFENSCVTEFRITATPELIQMFRRARRMFSLEQDEALTGADTLECLLASFFSSQPMDQQVLEELRLESDKDLQAERARELPEIMEAREKAVEMGLLSQPQDSTENGHQSKATTSPIPKQSCCHSKRPSGVVPEPNVINKSEEELLQHLSDEVLTCQNNRLRFNPQSRHTSKAQKKEILRRDAWCCQTPACPNQIWLDIHHLKPYAQGGQTVPSNLVSLCTACHGNLHAGILKITPNKTGKLIFTDQSGRRLDQQANLEMASWLDFWVGWKGSQAESHQRRTLSGDWVVFES